MLKILPNGRRRAEPLAAEGRTRGSFPFRREWALFSSLGAGNPVSSDIPLFAALFSLRKNGALFCRRQKMRGKKRVGPSGNGS